MNDMDNISIVNGELVDHEYDRQKQKRDKIRNIRKWVMTAVLILVPVMFFLIVWVHIFNEIRI